MEPLPGNWSICIGSVFEDAVDQLSILGTIVPSQRKSKNTYQLIADEITEILTEQKKIESEFDESAISGNFATYDYELVTRKNHEKILICCLVQ